MYNLLHILILFLLLNFQLYSQKFENSIITIDSNVFVNNEVLTLNQKWDFYWREFILPEEFENKNGRNIKLGLWNNITNEGEGYGTFRLQIRSNENNIDCSIYIPEIQTAYKCYWNNKLVSQNGIPGKDAKSAKPHFRPSLAPIIVQKGINELVFHISNFDHHFGGFYEPPQIGKTAVLYQESLMQIIYQSILFGAVFILALYHFVIYILRKKAKSALYFSLFAMTFAIRILFNESLILIFFPELPWSVLYKVNYLTFFIGPPLFSFFFKSLFPHQLKSKFIDYFIYIFFGLAIVCFFTPANIYTNFVMFNQILIVLNIFLCIFLLLQNHLENKGVEKELIYGFAFFLFTTLNDIMLNQKLISSYQLISVGMLVFIFIQTYVIAKRFNISFLDNLKLSETLDFQNKNLEQLVIQRTEQIQTQAEEIQTQAEEIYQQNDILTLQSAQLELKNEKILDSINYGKRIQNAMLPQIEEIEESIPELFVFFKPKDIVSGDFYWFSDIMINGLKNTIIAAVDCTGHGIPGAFMSMIGNELLNQIILTQQIYDPDKILNELRNGVRRVLKQESNKSYDGMDISLVRIDHYNKKMYFAGAMNPLFYVQNQVIFSIEANKFYIGGKQNKDETPFNLHSIDISTPTQFYLFTDGFQDQFGGSNGRKYMTKKFSNFLLSISHLNAKEQHLALENELMVWKGDKFHQIDDILILGGKV